MALRQPREGRCGPRDRTWVLRPAAHDGADPARAGAQNAGSDRLRAAPAKGTKGTHTLAPRHVCCRNGGANRGIRRRPTRDRGTCGTRGCGMACTCRARRAALGGSGQEAGLASRGQVTLTRHNWPISAYFCDGSRLRISAMILVRRLVRRSRRRRLNPSGRVRRNISMTCWADCRELRIPVGSRLAGDAASGAGGDGTRCLGWARAR